MANRAYLLNTATLSSDGYLLDSQLEQPGGGYLQIAESAYRIPVPWCCCFRQEDLQVVTIHYDLDEDEEQDPSWMREIALPCTTVCKAIDNLRQALPVFVALAGNERIGRLYWAQALEELQGLPLPYLTMKPLEVFFTVDPERDAEELRLALAGGTAALPHLAHLSGFSEGVVPYSPDVLYSVPGPNNDKERTENAVALDFGSSWFALGTVLQSARKAPTPGLAPGEPDLSSCLQEVEALFVKNRRNEHGCYGFMPGSGPQGQQLKLGIFMETDAELDALRKNAAFRIPLDGSIQRKLRTVCDGHGFEWLGYVFASGEMLKRDLKGDYNGWIRLPVARPYGSPEPASTPQPTAATAEPVWTPPPQERTSTTSGDVGDDLATSFLRQHWKLVLVVLTVCFFYGLLNR